MSVIYYIFLVSWFHKVLLYYLLSPLNNAHSIILRYHTLEAKFWALAYLKTVIFNYIFQAWKIFDSLLRSMRKISLRFPPTFALLMFIFNYIIILTFSRSLTFTLDYVTIITSVLFIFSIGINGFKSC